jgi:hypothetical protein
MKSNITPAQAQAPVSPGAPVKQKKKKPLDYVSNEDFYNLLKEYKKTGDRKVYEKIGKAFIKIASNILHSPNFINYTQDRKNEMISDATFCMVSYVDNFKFNKTDNPFAYFSQIAINAFKQNINKNNKRAAMFVPITAIQNMSREEINNKLIDGDE